jgi:YidC/Oxa1 family membrane protein insertase
MDNIRLALLLALAFVLYLLWQAWQQDYGSVGAPAPTAPTAQQAPGTPDLPAPSPVPAAAETPTATPVREPTLASTSRVQVRTDRLRAEIDTTGGDLRVVDLLTYPVTVDQPQSPYRLLGDRDGLLFVAQSGLVSQSPAPTHHAQFSAERTEYALADGEDTLHVPLRWQGDGGVQVTKVYTFRRDSYLVGLELVVENGTAEPWRGQAYSQILRGLPQDDGRAFVYTYTGAVLHSEDKRYEKVDFDRMVDAPVSRDAVGGWVAMIQHYFGAAWIPSQTDTNRLYARSLDAGRFLAGVVQPTFAVEPGQTTRSSIELFAGPKEQHRLAAAAPGLELLVDYGYLTLIAQPLYWLLEQINRLLGNWGWSIVVLTVLIKVAFFQLSATSYKSMANMRRLQPRLVALKERYGDDRARLNQAMMELYKTEKINPLGGCLPILVQIPVFIALYWVLLETVELRQAAFMLWVTDLSTHDPYFVLPILMGITMVIQQRLNPSPVDPVQQKVMMVLPFVFTVFFLFFPAGLVLYWLVNNALSILQQWLITRRIAPDSGS